MDILRNVFQEEDWPEDAENMYERIEVLGRGSFGLVWMGRRLTKPDGEDDDEYVALKNIEIKEEKGKVYAEREIKILTELRHPNVIRLIRAFPIYNNTARLVALQLARGPNLQRVVGKRGAIGLPLARLISRDLVAAVSYLHGRAVLHRDIKPTNCILENTELPPQEYYDYSQDSAIWSDGEDAQEAVTRKKWKMMLVDFGFARALEEKEVREQARPMRNSIILETRTMEQADAQSVDLSELDDLALIERTAAALRRESFQGEEFVGIGTDEKTIGKRRVSHVSNLVGVDEEKPEKPPTPGNTSGEVKPEANGAAKRRPSRFRGKRPNNRRLSTTRTKMRSMSALGTKAYAAPEIKHKLRNKTSADHEKKNAALTECVADYGMIVDAYSVGWTLRVILSGVPPNSTISQYMRKYDGKEISEEIEEVGCCCFGGGSSTSATPKSKPSFRVRDTDEMPKGATLFISALTKSNPEERLSIREAQNHPWIKGDETETMYEVVQGDVPSRHGDPVVPLKCAGELSKIVEEHHQ
mmetsp:Transcript_74317/g.111963  ORF Transcript_74317/g.111963 Transcript_74317/m.111963 type:complete len:528 (-) Transcript_74317:113-1696(-)